MAYMQFAMFMNFLFGFVSMNCRADVFLVALYTAHERGGGGGGEPQQQPKPNKILHLHEPEQKKAQWHFYHLFKMYLSSKSIYLHVFVLKKTFKLLIY